MVITILLVIQLLILIYGVFYIIIPMYKQSIEWKKLAKDMKEKTGEARSFFANIDLETETLKQEIAKK